MVVFSSCLKLSLPELFMSILSSMPHSFSHPFVMSSFCSFTFVDLGIVLDLLLLSFLRKISGQHIPEGVYKNDSKQGQCHRRAEGQPLCYNRVGFNILISIELLSHVLNNVPQLLQKLLLARIDFTLHLKFDFHV